VGFPLRLAGDSPQQRSWFEQVRAELIRADDVEIRADAVENAWH
jgi:hypothetical protein